MTAITAGGPLRSFRMRRQKAERWHRADTFLTHAVVLEEHPMPGSLRWVMLGVLGLIVGFSIWVTLAPMPERTRVMGEVQFAAPLLAVRSDAGGTILDLLVRDSQLVVAGTPLLRLDKRATEAELDRLWASAAALAMDSERLSALLEGRSPQFYRVAEGSVEIEEAQSARFDSQLAAEATRRSALDFELSMLASEIAAHQSHLASANLRLAMAQAERDLHQRLQASGMLPRMQLPEVELRHATASREVSFHTSELARLDSVVLAKRKQLEDGTLQARANLQAQHSAVIRQADEVRSAIERLTRQLAQAEIVAPAAGIVLLDAQARAGGRIAPFAEVARIAPMDEELRVSVQIAPHQDSRVRPGDAATIRFPAIDAAGAVEVPGRVEEFGRHGKGNRAPGSNLRASIRLDDPGALSERGLPLHRSLEAQVEIRSRRGSFLDYLLQPIRELAG